MHTTRGTDPVLHHEVSQFLYREAALLDDGRFDDWLELLADDIAYEMPVRSTRARASGNGFADDMTYFSEDRESLAFRVQRLDTDFAWAEDPPSRTRRFVTNVEVEPTDLDHELTVRSNTLVYRTRADRPEPDVFSCARHDVLRDLAARFVIARRTIHIDQTVLGSHNLSIFF